MAGGDAERWRRNLADEVDSAALYRRIAAVEEDEKLAGIYRRLATVEDRHAEFWRQRLRAADQPVPPDRVGWRARVLGWLAARFGPGFVLPALGALERGGAGSYDKQPETQGTELAEEERSHARLLKTIGEGGLEGQSVAKLEGRHRGTSGNALRAAVLGANDGLISNFSLVMGVAGAQLGNTEILITGLAGLVAGAGSMAMGEWISVMNARELYTRQIEIEREELEANPDEERQELVLIYEAKGLPAKEAEDVANHLMSSPARALDTMAREELGIDPEELGGSAVAAAGTSFALFAVGATLPILPYIAFEGGLAIAISAALAAAGLFGIGALITLVTGRGVLFSGGRQVLVGLAAAGLTFGIGSLIGSSL